MTKSLQVKNLTVTYKTADKKEKTALKNISFTVSEGEILAIIGPSGSGKTSLLRALSGLQQCDVTDISYGNKNLATLQTHQKGIGMVFQDGQLFPNYNVKNNIAYGLKIKKMSDSQQEEKVKQLLELVDLQGYENYNIQSLSGGQAQRVALARSLATNPEILLLDEPLSSLDKQLRVQLADDLRLILKKTQTTAIYVTHDQEEAFQVADKIAYISDGILRRIDTPQEIYKHPKTYELAKFLGYECFLDNIQASYLGLYINTSQLIATRPFAFTIAENLCSKFGSFLSTIKQTREYKDEKQALLHLDAGINTWIKIPEKYEANIGDTVVLQIDKSKCCIVSK